MIHGAPSLHLHVYHMMLFSLLHPQASHPATSPRSAEGNDTATPQDLWETHSCFYPCLQNILTPNKELLLSLVVYKAGAHLLGVSGSKSPAACLQWQVLIENQTRVASSLNLKASLWPSVNTQIRITLDADAKTQIIKVTCHNTKYNTKMWQYASWS